jgi:hypothetical protein
VLLAHGMIQGLLAWFGLIGAWVPGSALIVVLLVWHIRRRDRWRVRVWVLPTMLAESLLLAIPLLVISGLFAPAPPAGAATVRAQLLIALGAGVYEELVFRLLLISALAWLVARLAHTHNLATVAVAVALAAAAFALCHFAPIGADPFRWRTFWFKLIAGTYLGVIFLGRGLGIAAGAHAAYNVLLVALRGAAG